ncbi:hypothetical protein P7C73_g2439, partial [Tremellales sp. Uapishka_1]
LEPAHQETPPAPSPPLRIHLGTPRVPKRPRSPTPANDGDLSDPDDSNAVDREFRGKEQKDDGSSMHRDPPPNTPTKKKGKGVRQSEARKSLLTLASSDPASVLIRRSADATGGEEQRCWRCITDNLAECCVLKGTKKCSHCGQECSLLPSKDSSIQRARLQSIYSHLRGISAPLYGPPPSDLKIIKEMMDNTARVAWRFGGIEGQDGKLVYMGT